MICKSMHDPNTTHVSTFTHTFVIFNDLWYWNSKTALPYFCAFFYFAQTHLSSPKNPSLHFSPLCPYLYHSTYQAVQLLQGQVLKQIKQTITTKTIRHVWETAYSFKLVELRFLADLESMEQKMKWVVIYRFLLGKLIGQTYILKSLFQLSVRCITKRA